MRAKDVVRALFESGQAARVADDANVIQHTSQSR